MCVQWLWYSVIASVVLTVALNLAVRRWPDRTEHDAERLGRWMGRPSAPRDAGDGTSSGRVRVIVPWKAMLALSLGLTVLFNLLLRLGR